MKSFKDNEILLQDGRIIKSDYSFFDYGYVTTCFVCKGRVEQIAAIKDKTAAKAILKSLNETSILKPIKLDEDRGPPTHIQLFSEFFDESDSREYSQETIWSEV